MAKRTTDNKLDLDKDDIVSALVAAGWPLPDPAAPDSPPVTLTPTGSRWAFSWTTTEDINKPGP